jgi:hypothetical protein
MLELQVWLIWFATRQMRFLNNGISQIAFARCQRVQQNYTNLTDLVNDITVQVTYYQKNR